MPKCGSVVLTFFNDIVNETHPEVDDEVHLHVHVGGGVEKIIPCIQNCHLTWSLKWAEFRFVDRWSVKIYLETFSWKNTSHKGQMKNIYLLVDFYLSFIGFGLPMEII